MVSYRIDASARHAHAYAVMLTVAAPAAEQRLSLPAWIPGSYLVREFARHLSGLAAEQGGRTLPLQQLDKATWLVRCTPGEALTVRYRVHAFDLSVRAAYLDASRGFFNGTSLCLRVEGCEAQMHALTLVGLAEGWAVATTLDASDDVAGGASFSAPDYDTLVDHPVELGRFWRGRFIAAGVPHEFVVAGALPDFDGERLLADAERICSTTIAFWHNSGPPPFARYLFMLNAVEEGRGGLEHRSSTALVAPRRDLPRRPPMLPAGATASAGAAKPAEAETSDGYADVLGLIAHEYFHAWNVKRLRPAEFARFDYTRENYTELLWFFEGFTSYYDDLLVLRSGRIDAPRYLKLLAATLSAVAAAPGRHVQSVAASSYDAWVKYYRADENTPNATISYYLKGSLVALALDLTLAQRGPRLARRRHAASLADQRRRAHRRERDRSCPRNRRPALLCARAHSLGARHRRAAGRGAARRRRHHHRAPGGDDGAAARRARERERADRGQSEPRAARRGWRKHWPGGR